MFVGNNKTFSGNVFNEVSCAKFYPPNILVLCVLLSDANSLPDYSPVKCDHNCTNADGDYQCYCLTGFRLVNNENCTDIDECSEESDNCHANSTCLNTIGSYSCSCKNEDNGDTANCTGL